MAFDYDLFVIGAGSGGVRAGRLAAALGNKVAVAEEYRVGGTCVIRGCVPKKLFVYASQFAEEVEDAAGYGWQVEEPVFDWPTLIANKDREIARLNAAYIRNLAAAGAEIVQSRAILVDPHTVYLAADRRHVTAERILIATGATPFKPDLPGIEHAITSNEAFHLPRLPKRILVVGGGYIAVEFAGIFNGLGVETHIAYRGNPLLRGFDEDIRFLLTDEIAKKGIHVHTGCDVAAIHRSAGGCRVEMTDGSQLEVDLVMYATGRKPNTKGLGAERIGLELTEHGAVVVDAHSRTNIDNIYAVGDVTDRVALTPVAIREAVAFVETVYKDNPTAVDHSLFPSAVFSQPEIGTVGLTEAEARARHGEVDIYKAQFRPMKHTLSGRNEQMLMKLIVDPESDRVLGCHVLGPHSGELIQAVGIAVTLGATKAQFDATVAVHPTAAEELVTMREKWQPPRANAAE